MSYRVWLRASEYVRPMGESLSDDVFVAEFDRKADALDYVKRSGYVAELEGWMQGGAKWQACYRIEEVA